MRTKSFKYCSKRRKVGCRKASKTCSYRKNRTPKCQPVKKSNISRLKSGRNTKNPPKSRQSKLCSRNKGIDSCINSGKCVYDPRKKPKCDSRHNLKTIYDHFVDYKNMGFKYPITKKGIRQGIFVLIPEKNGYLLYLRYSKLLLKTMKPKYAKMLRYMWCKKGENAQQEYKIMLKNKYKHTEFEKYVEAMSHRIGDPFKVVFDYTLNELSNIWKSMRIPTHRLLKSQSESDYSDSDTDDYSDSDTDDYSDDPESEKVMKPKPHVAAKAAEKSAFMKKLPL